MHSLFRRMGQVGYLSGTLGDMHSLFRRMGQSWSFSTYIHNATRNCVTWVGRMPEDGGTGLKGRLGWLAGRP